MRKLQIFRARQRLNTRRFSNKGLALVQLQNYEDAVKVFDKAISIKSDIFSLWINKGLALCPIEKIYRGIRCL